MRKWKKRLQGDQRIHNRDIPKLIARAEELQQEHNAEMEQRKEEVTPQELREISGELDIHERFIEEALLEYQEENKPPPPPKEPPPPPPQTQTLDWRAVAVAGIIGLVLIAYILRPQSPSSNIVEKQIIVKEKEVETRVVTQKEVVRETKVITKTVIQTQTQTESRTETEPPTENVEVEIEEPPIIEPPKEEIPPKEEPVVQTKTVEETDPPLKQLSKQKTAKIKKLLRGQWFLVSYHLNNNGSYMEIPKTNKPFDLVENFTFKESKYRRVMDTNLSFSAKYEILAPIFTETFIDGTPFLLRATNVVSSIPGIQRPEEFFHGEISSEGLILFLIGSKLKRDKLPSQGHEYEKR